MLSNYWQQPEESAARRRAVRIPGGPIAIGQNEATPLMGKPASGWPTSAIVWVSVLALLTVAGVALAATFGALYASEKNAPPEPNIPLTGKLVLEWSDEFNGASLDRDKWESQALAGIDSGNFERQVYVTLDEPHGSKYTFIRDGNLVLRAETVPPFTVGDGGDVYIANSSKVYSRRMCHYGYTEVRVNVSAPADYVWPAVWFFPINSLKSEETPNLPTSPYENWPRTGEIDLVEVLGLTTAADLGNAVNQVSSGLIFGGPDIWGIQFGDGTQNDDITPNLADGQFHTFGLEWGYDSIRMWLDASVVDGEITGGTLIDRVDRGTWYSVDGMGREEKENKPFDQPMPITMNVAIISDDPAKSGLADSQSGDGIPDLPYELVVDYVRYYKFDGPPNLVQVAEAPKRLSKKSAGRRPVARDMAMPAHPPLTIQNAGQIIRAIARKAARMRPRPNITNIMLQLHQELLDNLAQNPSSSRRRSSPANPRPRSAHKRSTSPLLELDWAQEFDGLDLDRQFWRRTTFSAGQFDQYAASSMSDSVENSFLADGKLVLRGTGRIPVVPPERQYQRFFPFLDPQLIGTCLSAALITVNPCVGKGYLEVRARFPVADSIVPAIELLRFTKSKENAQNGVIPAGSIFLSQQQGLNNPETSEILFTHRGPGRDAVESPRIYAPLPGRDEFQVYGLEMLADGTFNWYLNSTFDPVTKQRTGGTLLHTVLASEYQERRTDGTDSANPLAPFDDDLFIGISLLMGNEITGIPGDVGPGQNNSYNPLVSPFVGPFQPPYAIFDDPLSAFEVDYVRYYKHL
jgi:beta-glucanase (GH16 family)